MKVEFSGIISFNVLFTSLDVQSKPVCVFVKFNLSFEKYEFIIVFNASSPLNKAANKANLNCIGDKIHFLLFEPLLTIIPIILNLNNISNQLFSLKIKNIFVCFSKTFEKKNIIFFELKKSECFQYIIFMFSFLIFSSFSIELSGLIIISV